MVNSRLLSPLASLSTSTLLRRFGSWRGAIEGSSGRSDTTAWFWLVVLRRDGRELLAVIPDVVILELFANGTRFTGGTVRYRPDGRSVLIFDH